jgi:hypothetical protein
MLRICIIRLILVAVHHGPVCLEAWRTCLVKSDVWELPGKLMVFAWRGKFEEKPFGWKHVPENVNNRRYP